MSPVRLSRPLSTPLSAPLPARFSSQSPLKRKRSADSAASASNRTASMPTMASDGSPSTAPPAPPPKLNLTTTLDDECAWTEPPSPTDTEIAEDIPCFQGQAACVAAAIAAGVKVRDYAYEPVSATMRLPELWPSPRQTLTTHDCYIHAVPARSEIYRLPVKMLWRLIDSGLVSAEEVQRNWPPDDRAAVDAYKARPGGPYPYRMPPTKKPTAAYRTVLRLRALVSPADVFAERAVYVPPDEPGMDDGAEDESNVADDSARTTKRRKLTRRDGNDNDDDADALPVRPPTPLLCPAPPSRGAASPRPRDTTPLASSPASQRQETKPRPSALMRTPTGLW
ncbi:uncharacterized protein FIBRA_08524 [Fibroporia radiculosa]|uniref:Uncharacterized protein n=1 Tax=Fibroporia radiculosa TaxID=599839 RepID=J4H580_9APHY|nr:uncharacterized protein FIBRA_08524 [Fibroporia radiculosa]CCM06274.1 predicted protein [Fibroporia radiculosa]